MHSFYALLRQSRQNPKELSKFKTTLITFQPTFVQNSNKNMCIKTSGSIKINNWVKF